MPDHAISSPAETSTIAPAAGTAGFGNMPGMQPRRWSVTVQRFDPTDMSRAEEFTLPVDCPDPEHAASAVLSNLIAWTGKTEGTTALPIAFRCLGVAERAG